MRNRSTGRHRSFTSKCCQRAKTLKAPVGLFEAAMLLIVRVEEQRTTSAGQDGVGGGVSQGLRAHDLSI